MDKEYLLEEYESTMFVEDGVATRVDSLSVADICSEISDELTIEFEALLEFSMQNQQVFEDRVSFLNFLSKLNRKGLTSLNSDMVKLIIWDLDDTLWKGTLSEQGTVFLTELAEYIKPLCKVGVMHSICSKNNEQEVRERLQAFGLWEYFIFPSVNWQPKGERIREIIKRTQINDSSAVFIDDNHSNLEEAKFYSESLRVQLPEHAKPFLEKTLAENKQHFDEDLKRLKQYKVLEKKLIQKSFFADNLSFLKDSCIKIELESCANNIDRIYELVTRTNQLNFTKVRSSYSELISAIEKNRSFLVKVSDKYGDYGIAGFISLEGNKASHFLFSCRVLGMKIESILYKYFDTPSIDFAEPLAIKLIEEPIPEWVEIKDISSNEIS